MGLLAWPAARLGAAPAAPSPSSSGVWPRALAVPGGIARLSLGPAAVRPVAHLLQADGKVPLLVVGDVIEWTALVGIALSATPGAVPAYGVGCLRIEPRTRSDLPLVDPILPSGAPR